MRIQSAKRDLTKARDMAATGGKIRVDRYDELREKLVPALLPYGLKHLAVFGSFVREEETPESDVDILVEFEEPRRIPLGLMGWVRLERELTSIVGKRVDLVSSAALNRNVRPYVESDMVVLFEAAG